MSSHVRTGIRCLVAHWGEKDGKQVLLEGCISCGVCGEDIRPEKMNEECPGPKPKQNYKEETLNNEDKYFVPTN